MGEVTGPRAYTKAQGHRAKPGGAARIAQSRAGGAERAPAQKEEATAHLPPKQEEQEFRKGLGTKNCGWMEKAGTV